MSRIEDLKPTLDRLQASYIQAGIPSAEERLDRIQRLMKLLSQHADDFCTAMNADFGHRSRESSLMTDVLSSFDMAKYVRANLRRWMKPERRKGAFPFNLFGARVQVRHDPKGIVGIMGTWNGPLYTLLAPLAFVLAGGNRAMLKPSDFAPHTADLLARLIPTFFSADEIVVFNGGPDMSAAFSALPFDHIVLTGSTGTGRAVMRAAAEHLVPVTLELGGKSPVIIGRSAKLDQAAERIMLAKLMNGGQVCVNADTVHVPTELLETFIEACRRHYLPMLPGGAQDPALVSIINDRHHQRLLGYLDEMRDSNTRIVEMMPGVQPAERRPLLRLVINPPGDSQLSCNEIFGPILQVQTYDTLDQALAIVNRGEKPLALYYFGHDAQEEARVLNHTRSGGVTVNDIMLHVAASDAPFGGVGGSGLGAYHGREGFIEFTHARTVFHQGWWDPRRALGLVPPYSPKVYNMLKKTLRV